MYNTTGTWKCSQGVTCITRTYFEVFALSNRKYEKRLLLKYINIITVAGVYKIATSLRLISMPKTFQKIAPTGIWQLRRYHGGWCGGRCDPSRLCRNRFFRRRGSCRCCRGRFARVFRFHKIEEPFKPFQAPGASSVWFISRVSSGYVNSI